MSYIFLDYLHLFDFDSGTTAISPAYFVLVILKALHQTMVYAVSAHNNLDSVAEAFLFSVTFSNPIDVHIIIIQILQSWKTILDFNLMVLFFHFHII
jgi:hypothetical protein